MSQREIDYRPVLLVVVGVIVLAFAGQSMNLLDWLLIIFGFLI